LDKVEEVEKFLWEIYEIDWRTKIRVVERENPEESEFYIRKYMLNLHFMNRFDRDPGFKQYLIDEVENNFEIVQKAGNYIESKKNTFEDLFNFKKTENDENNLHNLKIDEDLNYYKYKLEKLKNNKKTERNDEIIAIKSIISEKEKREINRYDLFQKNSILEKKHQKLHYFNSIGVKYTAENLIALDVLFHHKKSTDLNFLPEPGKKFIENALSHYSKKVNFPFTIFDRHSNVPIDNPNKMKVDNDFKFIWNFLKICSVLWFENKSEEQKIDILNGSYKFEITDSYIDNFVKFYGKNSLINISEVLYRLGYYMESLELYKYLLKVSENDYEKRLSLDNIATCYKEIEAYDLSIETYLNEWKSFKKDIGGYAEAVIFKNIAEIHFKLNRPEQANQYLSKIVSFLKNMNENDKFGIYFNLGMMSRRLYDYQNEYKYFKLCENSYNNCRNLTFQLNQMSQFEANFDFLIEKEDVINKVKNRKTQLDSYNNNFHTLMKEEKIERATKYFEMGNIYVNTFQFEIAISYFQRVNAILNTRDGNYSISYCYYHLYLQNLNKDRDLRNEYLDRAWYYSAHLPVKELFHETNNYLMPLNFFILNSLILEGKEGDYNLYDPYVFFEKYVQYLNLTNDDKNSIKHFMNALDVCLKYCLYFKNKKLTEKVFEHLLKELEKIDLPESPYLLVSYSFYNYFLFDFVHYYVNEGLKKVPEKDIWKFYNVKATAYYSEEKYNNAIEWYCKAIELDKENFDLWHNLSLAYHSSSKFTKALKAIQKSIDFLEIDSDDYKNAKYLEYEFKEDSQNQIDIGLIDENDIKKFIIDAEDKLLSADESNDYSMVAINYSKVIETTLKNKVIDTIHKNIENKYTSKEIGDYKNTNPPKLLRDILASRSPSLGSWVNINMDLENFETKLKNDERNPIALYLKEKLKE